MDNQERKERNPSRKVVVLGDVAVGKTSIIQRYINGIFANLHNPTIGAMFQAKRIKLNESSDEIKLEIWDTAGQERFYAITPMYYRKAHAAIVVFDISNKNSLDRAGKWINELLQKADKNIIIALCGNKVDLEERNVTFEEGKSLADENGCMYIEVSAKQNINIEELFIKIAEKFPIIMEIEDKKLIEPKKFSKTEDITNTRKCTSC